MKCPKCGSENCQFHTKTKVNASLFSWKDACCGSVCLGPLGILCGLCGTNIDTTTKEFWVCNDCGKKFEAGGVLYDIKNALEDSGTSKGKEKKNQTLKFVFESEESYGQYASDEMVYKFERIIESGRYAECMEKIVYRNNDSVDMSKLFQKYSKYSLENDVVLFIFGEKNDIVVTLRGIYAGEEFYVYQNNGVIAEYGDGIYFNQICIKFNAEEKEELFSLLMEILPQETFCRECEYENLLRILQSLPDQKYMNEYHFSSQKDYADYVNQLKKGKIKEFISNSRNRKLYREYKNIYEKKDREENIMTFLGFVISLILGIRQWVIEGWLNGIIVGIFFIVVSIIFVALITGSKKWNAYKSELLPEKLILLINESKSPSFTKYGKIKPEDYIEDFSELGVEEKHSGDIICSNCGYAIPQGAKWCPVCGEKVKKKC